MVSTCVLLQSLNGVHMCTVAAQAYLLLTCTVVGIWCLMSVLLRSLCGVDIVIVNYSINFRIIISLLCVLFGQSTHAYCWCISVCLVCVLTGFVHPIQKSEKTKHEYNTKRLKNIGKIKNK